MDPPKCIPAASNSKVFDAAECISALCSGFLQEQVSAQTKAGWTLKTAEDPQRPCHTSRPELMGKPPWVEKSEYQTYRSKSMDIATLTAEVDTTYYSTSTLWEARAHWSRSSWSYISRLLSLWHALTGHVFWLPFRINLSQSLRVQVLQRRVATQNQNSYTETLHTPYVGTWDP